MFSEREILGLMRASTILVLLFVFSGCSSFGRTMKSLVSSDEPARSLGTRFSEQDQVPAQTERKYRRMTRDRFEEDSEVDARAGSLWVMEGQGAYLFSQNKMRMQGDLLNVRLEGSPRAQLQSKVRTISKLLERLDGPVRGLASVPNAAKGPSDPAAANSGGPDSTGAGAQQGDASSQGAAPTAAPVAGAAGQPGAVDKNDPLATIQTIPTRIVDQLKDGSYRVRGLQSFMIGRREYRVIVTGVVRQEDFDEQGIDSSKLLDPQFDIVSARKGATL